MALPLTIVQIFDEDAALVEGLRLGDIDQRSNHDLR